MESDKLAKAKMIRLGRIFRPGPVIRLKGEIRVGLAASNDASFVRCVHLVRLGGLSLPLSLSLLYGCTRENINLGKASRTSGANGGSQRTSGIAGLKRV